MTALIDRTINALRKHDLPVDEQIWFTPQAACYDDETNDGGPN